VTKIEEMLENGYSFEIKDKSYVFDKELIMSGRVGNMSTKRSINKREGSTFS